MKLNAVIQNNGLNIYFPCGIVVEMLTEDMGNKGPNLTIKLIGRLSLILIYITRFF